MAKDNDDNATGWKSFFPGEQWEKPSEEPPERPKQAAGEPEGRLRDAAAGPEEERPLDVGYPREFPSTDAELGKRKKSGDPGNRRATEAKSEGKAPEKRRRKPRPALWSFFIALGIVLVSGGAVLFYIWNGLRPTAAKDPVRFTIERGSSADEVAAVLETNGLIRNAFLFDYWLKLKDEGSRFQAGEYEMAPGSTLEEIVAKLNSGDTVAAETIRFTIPEGFTVVQMADKLAAEGIADKDKFLAALNDPSALTGSVWVKQIPDDDDLRYPLEGYLFPDTYELKKGSTEIDIVNRMLSELDRKLNQLPEDWQTTLEEREMTVHELLTLASLIEREVVLDEERPIVASVIENRIEEKMPLQIDATIQYLLDKQKENLTEADLKVDSPYNTYQNAGLPPGPIATPGLKSIEAVLYPAETDYFYYVTKKDGSNQHLFASTYSQHLRNKEQSERNVQQ